MDFKLIDKDYRPEAVILCGGSFPTSDIPLNVLRNAAYVCCCDGAAAGYIGKGHRPDVIVGDGDSLNDCFKEKYRDILHIENEQEDNDQTKATRYCISRGFRNIAYLGATGKREDHTIGNVSLLEGYMDEFGINPVMLTDYGYFIPACGKNSFMTFPRQQVSIFNFSCKRITGSGFRWPVYPYCNWWQGTLNEATGDSITLDTDGNTIVYLTYEEKNERTV